MSATTATPMTASMRRSVRRRVAVALAWPEAKRLLRHPCILAGLAVASLMLLTRAHDGPSARFETLTAATMFLTGPLTYFGTNLAASRDRRAGTAGLIASTPTRAELRTAVLCLSGLAPAAVLAVLNVLAWAGYGILGLGLERAPTVFEFAAPPLALFGAACLGVMVARWAPWPGVAALVLLLLVVFNLWVDPEGDAPYRLLGPYASFATWEPNGAAVGFYPGSAGWHAGYLLCLSVLAAAGAILPDARRRGAVLTAGVLLGAGVLLAGWAQLP